MNFSLHIPDTDLGPVIVVNWKTAKDSGSMSFTSFRQFGETVSAFRPGVEWAVDPGCEHPMIIAGRALARALFNVEAERVRLSDLESKVVAGVGFGVRAKPGADRKLREATA